MQNCKLDGDDCLCLLNVLQAFDGPINEERTWAVLYQAAKTALAAFRSHSGSPSCLVASEAAHVFIHKDGAVHAKSFAVVVAAKSSSSSSSSSSSTTDSKLIA